MKDGKQTSEYGVAKILVIIGTAMTAAGASLGEIFPHSTAIALVVAVGGILTTVAGALGYQVPRGLAKAAAAKGEALERVERVKGEALKLSPTQPASDKS